MQKNISRLFAGVMVIVLLSFFAIPASAADSGLVGTVQSFVEWSVNKQDDFANSFWKAIFGDSFNAEDFTPGGKYGGGAGREELQAAYDAYVSDLPAGGYTSSGKLLWQPTFSDFDTSSKFGDIYPSALYGQLSFSEIPYVGDACKIFLNSTQTGFCISSFGKEFAIFRFSSCIISPPIDGAYSALKDSPFLSGAVVSSKLPDVHDLSKVSVSVTPHADGKFEFSYGDRYTSAWIEPGVTYVYFPIFEITPYDFSGDTYNINTRPTSITGGNYGIVGDNGQITKVEDNSTIINETNNTFYNPATGTTVPIVNWSYDYSDRSYKVTLESGDTATITYGDENITIQETTVTEGDTITNNYTIYYLVDGSGSVTPPCAHEWAETNTTPATCTVSGSKLLTCSKCQQTKTEPLPVLGHDWQIKQTVTTQYDDTGQLIQEGYTIFECSRCHEQYKSADGTIPPGGSGTDPGGDEDETLWDKLGNWAASVFGGLIGMAEAILGKILDALISLTDMLMERLKTVVETVLAIFDELPKLFGGFLDFLGAVFPFLPPELMTLLTFGVIAVVAIGIFKAVRR